VIERSIWVANAGDCRVVLGSVGDGGALVACSLSTDHKVDAPREQAPRHGAPAHARARPDAGAS
jgi:serine/threonine protein phosphatase PrpC